MKIKKYESFEEPKINDYVICEDRVVKDINDFLSKNIGRIVDYNSDKYNLNQEYKYIVKYDKIPDIFSSTFRITTHKINYYSCRGFGISEIKFFSSNKEDCEAFLTAKKYNI